MKIKHFYAFGNEVTEKMRNGRGGIPKVDWDIVREAGGDAFRMEQSREEFVKASYECGDHIEKARIILSKIGGAKVCSLGCGKGGLEYVLKTEQPELYLCCSDYTEKAIQGLRELFPECDEYCSFDMLHGDYGRLKGYDHILMNRVSTEFTEKEWRGVFQTCHNAGIKSIIFIPTEVMKVRDIIREWLLCLRWQIRGERLSFCGWMYSESEFMKIWKGLYRVDTSEHMGNTAVYFLKGE